MERGRVSRLVRREGAAGGFRSPGHEGKLLPVIVERGVRPKGVSRIGEHFPAPAGKIRMKTIENPDSFSSVQDNAVFFQIGHLSGDGRLRKRKGIGKLADAQLLFLADQDETTKTNGMAQGRKPLVWRDIHISIYIEI